MDEPVASRVKDLLERLFSAGTQVVELAVLRIQVRKNLREFPLWGALGSPSFQAKSGPGEIVVVGVQLAWAGGVGSFLTTRLCIQYAHPAGFPVARSVYRACAGSVCMIGTCSLHMSCSTVADLPGQPFGIAVHRSEPAAHSSFG